MMMARFRCDFTLMVLVTFHCTWSSAATFKQCKTRVESILRGLPDPFPGPGGNLTKEGLQKYIYTGPVRNLSPSYDRDSYVTLTLEGCREVCDSPIDWYLTEAPTLSLSIASNWILPILALIACLPYDSLHSRTPPSGDGRLFKTAKTLANWLGSPATALTATLFNIHQIRQCKQYIFLAGGSHEQVSNRHIKRNAYYVLSCINQFEPPDSETERAAFVDVLVYGLFRPMTKPAAGRPRELEAALLTRELLEALAFQLRMFRRRGVYPAGINIIVFLGAFAISVGLAFASDLGEWTTAHSLALGLLVSWLPILVTFSILDRNPISAIRNRVLIERWLWNVEAIRLWQQLGPMSMVEQPQDQLPPTNSTSPALPSQSTQPDKLQQAEEHIDWWTPSKQSARNWSSRSSPQSSPLTVPKIFQLGEFIGQGRKMGYHGLASAVLTSIYNHHPQIDTIAPITSIASSTNTKLGAKFHRPAHWWVLALVSLGLVWLEILMALVVSMQTPTVGLSCRSGAYVTYGLLASVAWVVSCVSKSPGYWTRAGCYLVNGLAVAVLSFIVFAQFSGILNNCPCKCGIGGYMGFEDAAFFKDNFGVSTWWGLGAALGGLPPIVCFVAAAILYGRLKELWVASEQSQPSWDLTDWRQEILPVDREETIHANMLWLS
ncbi:hypothetical protein B0H63DRAFT_431774 [Podospora didyma]|uniref:Uncharacterized protein n=1 Tax=Podospora didyma TaxID=330526 RepID=A0AAE0NU82_9PEZI|nr:hypothetical protein B0H63DRAFT_431774 [Podospora didyma]